MTHLWLKLDLAAPLMAFGGVAIDQNGPTRDFPAASMLTGLIANALGLHWRDRAAHQDIQDRLIFATAIAREGVVVTDSQNAKLEKNDKGWTTRGEPDGRDGASYGAPHRRRRNYMADAEAVVVARLSAGTPTTEGVAEALHTPARPLFIGRKPCFPTRPILAGTLNATSAHEALTLALTDTVTLSEATTLPNFRAQWPETEGPTGNQRLDLPDLRNWISGLHGGTRPVIEGHLP